MVTKIDEQFMHDVLNIVNIIPFGRVATYGQIARLIGRPQNARLVGKALGKSGGYGKHPCHRVVTATRRLVPGWFDQRPMLLAENVPFKDDNHVAIKKCQWQGI